MSYRLFYLAVQYPNGMQGYQVHCGLPNHAGLQIIFIMTHAQAGTCLTEHENTVQQSVHNMS